MSRQLTALKVTPLETYTTRDGSPYRADWTGIVHVEVRHVAELLAASAPPGAAVPILATAAHLNGTIHQGISLSLTVENG